MECPQLSQCMGGRQCGAQPRSACRLSPVTQSLCVRALPAIYGQHVLFSTGSSASVQSRSGGVFRTLYNSIEVLKASVRLEVTQWAGSKDSRRHRKPRITAPGTPEVDTSPTRFVTRFFTQHGESVRQLHVRG